jgi:hypothetical protein
MVATTCGPDIRYCRRPRGTRDHAAGRDFLRLGGGSDQMVAEAHERGFCFDGAGGEQDVLAPLRVCPLPA